MNKRGAYRPSQKTAAIRAAILDIFREERPPLTVRRVFYALTVRGVIPKTDAGYRTTCYQTRAMRLDGTIPYGFFADGTRWQIRPTTYDGLSSALEEMQEMYRRDLWSRQPHYLEFWVEKDALASVISPITTNWNVPLWVARGFSSLTTLYEAAQQIKRQRRPAYIYHLGDFDPSGVLAAETIGKELARFGANITFTRLGITEEQIAAYNLPTRPTKRTNHSKRLDWGNTPSCELDALPTPILRDLVQNCIISHIDPHEWEGAQAVEREERQTLADVISKFGTSANIQPDGQP